MAALGNAQEGSSEEKVGAIGETGIADVLGQDPIEGFPMGDNGPHPKREGEGVGVLY